jgi:hypothetical protein
MTSGLSKLFFRLCAGHNSPLVVRRPRKSADSLAETRAVSALARFWPPSSSTVPSRAQCGTLALGTGWVCPSMSPGGAGWPAKLTMRVLGPLCAAPHRRSLHTSRMLCSHAPLLLLLREIRDEFEEQGYPAWSSIFACTTNSGLCYPAPARQTPRLPACSIGPAHCAMDARASTW